MFSHTGLFIVVPRNRLTELFLLNTNQYESVDECGIGDPANDDLSDNLTNETYCLASVTTGTNFNEEAEMFSDGDDRSNSLSSTWSLPLEADSDEDATTY